MKTRSVMAIAVLIALGLPGIYVICLAAGVDPVDRLVNAIKAKEDKRAKPLGPAPFVPDPPESERMGPFERQGPNGEFERFYESKLAPQDIADKIDEAMKANGWQSNEQWTRIVGGETREGIRRIYGQNGWQCDIYIHELKKYGMASDVTMHLLPSPSNTKPRSQP